MVIYMKQMLYVYVILNIISAALCVKCFSCRSSDDPKCADPFDNSTIQITNCDQENKHSQGFRPSLCRKIKQKVDGEWHYTRDCAYGEEADIEGDEKLCFMRTGSNNILEEYCTCNAKDGCNSANIKNPNAFIILTTVTCFFYKMSQ